MPRRGGSHFNTTPPPLLSFFLFSTQLTFKLWHQLPCQTCCDFPLLHLPSLPTGAVSPLAAFSSLLPAHSISLLSLPWGPIHKIPGSAGGPAAGGHCRQSPPAPPALVPSLQSRTPDSAVRKITSAQSCSLLPCSGLEPSHQPLPTAAPCRLFLLPHSPQPHLSQKPHRDVPSA